jgi:acyl carrier protein
MLNDQSNYLLSVISEVFAPAEVSPTSTLESLGATSVTLLRLMAAVRRELDVELDVVDMFSIDDVGDLIRLVGERKPALQ